MSPIAIRRRGRPGKVRFEIVALVALIAVSALLLLENGGRRGDARRDLDVIVITLDTFRFDRLGAHGHSGGRTPHLDALARESIVFTDCMTTAPTTLAAHTSLFTGKHPHSHGVPRNGFTVHPENRTLAEILRDRGYATAGFAASFALDARFGIAQGFDRYDADFDLAADDEGRDQNQRDARAVTEAALRHLEQSDGARRQLLFVHYFDPHLPYDPPEPWARLHGESEPRQAIDVDAVRERATLGLGVDFPAAERLVRRHDGEVSYLDREIGRLVSALRESGALDRSLLVVVSDHGENFHDHEDTFDHGLTVYDTTVRAACMIRLPGTEAGRESGGGSGRPSERGRVDDSPISVVDLLPTILDRLGIEAPPRIDGRVLDLDGQEAAPSDRLRFAEATKPWDDVEGEGRWHNLYKARCVRAGPWKLVQVPYLSREELYRLDHDPGERLDLLRTGLAGEVPDPQRDETVRRLRTELEVWARSVVPLPSRFHEGDSDDTADRLRDLGYLDSRQGGRK